MRETLAGVVEQLEKIEKKFPPATKRLIEIES